MKGQRHAPTGPYLRERLDTHSTGGWVGFRAGLDMCGKSRPNGIRSPDRPARRQSLYRLSYRAPHTLYLVINRFLVELFCLVFQARSQNCEKRILASPCPSVRPHGKTRLPLDGFSLNLACEYFFFKSVEKIQISLKSEKNNGYFT